MITRTGKIARLPDAIREELNRRLDDGEVGLHVIDWLNGLPEVQKMLAEEFEGKPICSPNLSAWKQGGFVEWKHRQETREFAMELIGPCSEMEFKEGHEAVLKRAEFFILLALSGSFRLSGSPEDMAAQSRIVLDSAAQLNRLRQANLADQRLELAREIRETCRDSSEYVKAMKGHLR
jgi:hypothetical protein